MSTRVERQSDSDGHATGIYSFDRRRKEKSIPFEIVKADLVKRGRLSG